MAQDSQIPRVLFSLYVNDVPARFHHVECASYADATAIIATSCLPAQFVIYRESCLKYLERPLREWRITINVSNSIAMLLAKASRRIQKLRPVLFFGVQILWFDKARYERVTFDTRLGLVASYRSGSDLSWKGGLTFSNRNRVMLYEQLLRPIMHCACPIWRFAAGTHVRKLQVLQCKCFHIAIRAN